MKVLLTGPFGNIGTSAIPELLEQGHTVRTFDIPTTENRSASRKYRDRIETVRGDIRVPEDVIEAVRDREIVIHLAAIIPPKSDADPDLAQAVNVGGTTNVIRALEQAASGARLIHASSLALFGKTQDRPPPRTVDDPIVPTDPYTHHKAECETRIRASGLTWAILRFGAVLSVNALSQIDPIMFEVPLGDRIEFVHTRDVGLALANAVSSTEIWGKTLLIGGGPRCQLYQREIIQRSCESLGIGMLPDSAFTTTPYHTDWLDTAESQRLLRYQRLTLDDYVRDVVARVGSRRVFIKLLRPLVRRRLLALSPYYGRQR